eukprot:gnl/TRDRNA2_/TRDRNA2_170420_c1_seq2.p1 gnl/TRDRNA2_/TRDRNA2_170420_c1~~gnl/TRDRNA2_/TRDRNA2_170420_c1_seq2.p1  ORF type:complete len:1058 (-),score=218.36 gnl/TRDRNA2_/TRDRNA2_170420_c1_seq2:50-2824(-)
MALAEAHAVGAVHGRLSPHSLVLAADDAKQMVPQVKVCDFGQAFVVRPGILPNREESLEVADYILSPETLSLVAADQQAASVTAGAGFYEVPPGVSKQDVWALGVMAYHTITGVMPFAAGRPKSDDVIDGYGADKMHVSFDHVAWSKISPHALDAVTRMLKYAPEERISARALLRHPWFCAVKDVSSTTRHTRASFEHISSAGVTPLIAALPSSLVALRLDFRRCPQIDDETLQAMAGSLPISLRTLQLAFQWCVRIGSTGVTSLASGLPSSLQELRLRFDGCHLLGNAGVAACGKAISSLRQLEAFELGMACCPLISDSSMTALAHGLPSTLRQLQLRLGRCEQLGDSGITILARSLPPSLEAVDIAMWGSGVSKEMQSLCNSLEALRSWQREEGSHSGTDTKGSSGRTPLPPANLTAAVQPQAASRPPPLTPRAADVPIASPSSPSPWPSPSPSESVSESPSESLRTIAPATAATSSKQPSRPPSIPRLDLQPLLAAAAKGELPRKAEPSEAAQVAEAKQNSKSSSSAKSKAAKGKKVVPNSDGAKSTKEEKEEDNSSLMPSSASEFGNVLAAAFATAFVASDVVAGGSVAPSERLLDANGRVLGPKVPDAATPAQAASKRIVRPSPARPRASQDASPGLAVALEMREENTDFPPESTAEIAERLDISGAVDTFMLSKESPSSERNFSAAALSRPSIRCGEDPHYHTFHPPGDLDNANVEEWRGLTWPPGGLYTGDFHGSLMQGEGTFAWPDGRRYNGQWKGNTMHGEGRFVFADGRVYEGQYVNNRREGEGMLLWEDGCAYIGQWKGGRQHGDGMFKCAQSEPPRLSTWRDGVFEHWVAVEPPQPASPLVSPRGAADALVQHRPVGCMGADWNVVCRRPVCCKDGRSQDLDPEQLNQLAMGERVPCVEPNNNDEHAACNVQ